MDTSEKFTLEVERRLHSLFNASREGYKTPDTERHRLTGFINAGVFLGFTTNEEMHDLMESVHLSVFGKSIKERKESQPIAWEENNIDYGQYEQPAFERTQQKQILHR